eukprot:scaffold7337_cov66-Skeletonema_dohrnii-CCMP3373.AAC.9
MAGGWKAKAGLAELGLCPWSAMQEQAAAAMAMDLISRPSRTFDNGCSTLPALHYLLYFSFRYYLITQVPSDERQYSLGCDKL